MGQTAVGRGRTRHTGTVLGVLTVLLATGLGTAPGTWAETAAVQPQTAAAQPRTAVADAGDPGEAATEQSAQAAARATGKPVEVAGLRQERRDVFANPNGTFTAREYTQPVRVRKGTAWQAVDDTLVRRDDGRWAPRAATVGVEFSDGGSGPFARMSKAGREYALTWPGGPLPKPKVSGNTALYEEVGPGVDLAVRAEAEGFGHYVIVKSAEAAANPELSRIELDLTAKGLTVQETGSGGIRAVDAAVGGTVFEAARAVMWDSDTGWPTGSTKAGRATAPREALDAARAGRKAPVDTAVSKNRITLTPDVRLLRGKDTVYPVVIDPIPKTVSRTSWTSVMSGMPTEQDWAYTGSAGAGKCPLDYNPVTCAGVGVRRLLFTFPTSPYSGKQILGAQFSARVEHVYWADAKAEPVDLYRIGGKDYKVTSASNWSNTQDDWSDHLTTVDTKIQPTSCSSAANLHFSNGELLTEMQTAASGGWKTMSLGLRAKDESTYGGWKRVCGNAYLQIQYNTPPSQVDSRLMTSNPGGKCVSGTTRPYADVLPRLRAEARDPDHGGTQTDQVKMQFRVTFKDTTGVTRSYTGDTGYKAPNAGTPFTFQVTQRPAGTPQIPQNSPIQWDARAFDGDAWGPWSSDGTALPCEFVWDSTRPKPPVVSSSEYPADEQWHHGVGTLGRFSFTAADKDVKEYRYTFDDEATKKITTTAGARVTVDWTPTAAGRHWVTVEAYDGANNSNLVPAHYEFLVTDGRQAAGQWNLADQVGATEAHDETGRHPAVVGTGVTFQVPGPGGGVDSAARFDGTAGAYLDSWGTIADTGNSFAVSAWVKPASLDRDMAVVSQDSTGEPGFVLGYDAVDKAWVFSTPDQDVEAMSDWRAVATGTVTANQWVLLTGVFDAHAATGPELRIYVNDKLGGTAKRHTVWSSLRSLQLGRTLTKSGYRDHFQGDLAEVRVFDRVLPAAQVAELMTVKPQRKAYWPLEKAVNGASANTQKDGLPLTLHGDAALYTPATPFDDAALADTGHLALDGTDAWADTSAPVVSGAESYTVAARVRLTTLSADKSQTVLSLPGQHADRVTVRYQATTGQWELAVTDTDGTAPKVTTISHEEVLPTTDVGGQHLAVSYDAFTHEVRLYVDGRLTRTATGMDHTTWPSTRGLQVGRSAQGGGSEYFAGAIDEVRAYAGAVDPIAVTRMNVATGDPDM
ncbi:LamG domain-containing protein [Streptomyces sp. NPDC050504]|uniref:LamG domain-containing protein n=1 Tax=Streptomyces sp. NPDC050504 TaxID=3365618 RepID=UPI0037B9E0CF